MENIAVVILAGGQEKEMKSDIPKVLHPLCGIPVLNYFLEISRYLNSLKTIVIVNSREKIIEKQFGSKDLLFIGALEKQENSVTSCINEALQGFEGQVVLLPGNTPLLRKDTVKKLVSFHEKSQVGAATLAVTDHEKRNEFETGVYCFSSEYFSRLINGLTFNDLFENSCFSEVTKTGGERKDKARTLLLDDSDELMKVNNRVDLAKVNKIMRSRIINNLMLEGVTFIDPHTAYVEKGVIIGKDTVVYPNCFFEGRTKIGARCIIEGGTKIVDSEIGDSVTIMAACVITESKINGGATIGPFAHLRPQTELAEGVKIGNFVEIKKSKLGNGSKAAHLTYIGDSEIGKDVNIGCGTITCNYDGKRKYRTIIGDRVFVGSDTQFIAPVKIGEGSTIGAGSTITKNVPADSLALSRVKQKILRKIDFKAKNTKK